MKRKGMDKMKQTDWTHIGKLVLIGAGTSAVTGLVWAMLLGWAAGREWLEPEGCGLLTVLLTNGVLFLMCWLTANRAGQSRLPVSFAVAVVYWLLCLICKALVFSTETIAVDWRMALPAAMAVGAGLLASRKKTRRR